MSFFTKLSSLVRNNNTSTNKDGSASNDLAAEKKSTNDITKNALKGDKPDSSPVSGSSSKAFTNGDKAANEVGEVAAPNDTTISTPESEQSETGSEADSSEEVSSSSDVSSDSETSEVGVVTAPQRIVTLIPNKERSVTNSVGSAKEETPATDPRNMSDNSKSESAVCKVSGGSSVVVETENTETGGSAEIEVSQKAGDRKPIMVAHIMVEDSAEQTRNTPASFKTNNELAGVQRTTSSLSSVSVEMAETSVSQQVASDVSSARTALSMVSTSVRDLGSRVLEQAKSFDTPEFTSIQSEAKSKRTEDPIIDQPKTPDSVAEAVASPLSAIAKGPKASILEQAESLDFTAKTAPGVSSQGIEGAVTKQVKSADSSGAASHCIESSESLAKEGNKDTAKLDSTTSVGESTGAAKDLKEFVASKTPEHASNVEKLVSELAVKKDITEVPYGKHRKTEAVSEPVDEVAVDEGIVENGDEEGEQLSEFTDEEVEPTETEDVCEGETEHLSGEDDDAVDSDIKGEETEHEEEREEDLDFDEDKRNPQYIPKKGAFYEHDDRRGTDDESDENANGGAKGDEGLKGGGGVECGASGAGGSGGRGDSPEHRGGRAPKVLQSETRDRWDHDLFDASQQAPKTSDELIAQYGYDIRDESAAPRAARRRRYGRGPTKYSRDWHDEKAYHGRATHGGQERPERHNGQGRVDKEFYPLKDDFPCLSNAGQQHSLQQQQHASKEKDQERDRRQSGNHSERMDTRENRRDKDPPRRNDGKNKHEVQRREISRKDSTGSSGLSYPTTAHPSSWSQRGGSTSSTQPLTQTNSGGNSTSNHDITHQELDSHTSSAGSQPIVTALSDIHAPVTTPTEIIPSTTTTGPAVPAPSKGAAVCEHHQKATASQSASSTGHKDTAGPPPHPSAAGRNDSRFENASLQTGNIVPSVSGSERASGGARGLWERANRDTDEQQPALEWRSAGRSADGGYGGGGSRGSRFGDRADRGGDIDRDNNRDYNASSRDHGGNGREYGGGGRDYGGGRGRQYYDRDYHRDRPDRTDRDHNSGSRSGDVGHRVIGGDRERWRSQGSGRFGDHRGNNGGGGYDLRHKLDNNRNNDRYDSRGENRRDSRGGQRDNFADHNMHSRGDNYRDGYRDNNYRDGHRDSRENYRDSRDSNRGSGTGGDGHTYRESRDGGYRERDRDHRDSGNGRDQRDNNYRANNNRSEANGRESGYSQNRGDNGYRENWRENRDSQRDRDNNLYNRENARESYRTDHPISDTCHRDGFQKDGGSRGGSDVRDMRGTNRVETGRKIGSGRTQDPRVIRKGQQQHQQQQHESGGNNNNNNGNNNNAATMSGGLSGHQGGSGKTGDAVLDRKISDEKRQHQHHLQQQNVSHVSETKRYTAQRAATRAEFAANQVPVSQPQPATPQPQLQQTPHGPPAAHQQIPAPHAHTHNAPHPGQQQQPAYYEVAPPHAPPPGGPYFVSQAFDAGAVPTGAPPQGFISTASFLGPPPFIAPQTHASFMMGAPVPPEGPVHHGPPHAHHHPDAQLIPPAGGITYYSPQQQMYITHQQKPPQPRPKAIIPIVPPPDNTGNRNGAGTAGGASAGGPSGPEAAAAPAQVEA